MRICIAWFGIVTALIFLLIVFPWMAIAGRLADDFPIAAAGLIFWGTILVRSWLTVWPRPQPELTEYESISSTDLIKDKATQLLAAHLKDGFRVFYDPAFPKKDGSSFSWFQVILVVGPGNDDVTRNEVHQTFLTILSIIATMNVVRRADLVSLRARRHVPPHSSPDYPLMFIECSWHGSDLLSMLTSNAFEDWHSRCISYINRFDRKDPLNLMRPTAAD